MSKQSLKEDTSMTSSFLDKLHEILSKPIIPEKIVGERYDSPIYFFDSDATAEEIDEFLNRRTIDADDEDFEPEIIDEETEGEEYE